MILIIMFIIIATISQIFICKKLSNKKLGLILPIFSLIGGLSPFICSLVFILLNIKYINSSVFMLLYNTLILTIISIIPFIIFISIYFYYKKEN